MEPRGTLLTPEIKVLAFVQQEKWERGNTVPLSESGVAKFRQASFYFYF
jgi:hypothetical protein